MRLKALRNALLSWRYVSKMSTLVPLMLVPLIIWIAVWAYLWSLDAKVRRLERVMHRFDAGESEDL